MRIPEITAQIVMNGKTTIMKVRVKLFMNAQHVIMQIITISKHKLTDFVGMTKTHGKMILMKEVA